MIRSKKRNNIRSCYKKIKVMSLGQFEKFLNIINQETADEVEQAYLEALKKEFGFGPKRLEKIKNIAQEFYWNTSETKHNDEKEG